MAQLTSVKTKTISEIFQDRNADFLIPVYQRAYVWEAENECQALWDDIVSFAFPEEGKFDTNEQYFLGSIVTFRNENKQLEVIDGQQRLTTFMLLLCALYEKCGGFDKKVKDDELKEIVDALGKCIWRTDEQGKIDYKAKKLNSQVAEEESEELAKWLSDGMFDYDENSWYSMNYYFFADKINEFAQENPTMFIKLPTRILNNLTLLPIEADSKETATMMFYSLNNKKGKFVDDVDVFKVKFYEFYAKKGKQDEFIKEWNGFKNKVEKHWSYSDIVECFFKYCMYFEMAKRENEYEAFIEPLGFYQEGDFRLLNEEMFENLKILADFWCSVMEQDKERFSERVLKSLIWFEFSLNNIDYMMWRLISVYFMFNKDQNGRLDDDKFFEFLQKTIAFLLAQPFVLKNERAQEQLYLEMINIKNNKPLFEDVKFDAYELREKIENYGFSGAVDNAKQILAWWVLAHDEQELIEMDDVYDDNCNANFHVEHIFARKRAKEMGLNDKLLECLGNKSLLESNLNIAAKDRQFHLKKEFYRKSNIAEIREIANSGIRSFNKDKIIERNEQIIDALLSFVEKNGLLG